LEGTNLGMGGKRETEQRGVYEEVWIGRKFGGAHGCDG